MLLNYSSQTSTLPKLMADNEFSLAMARENFELSLEENPALAIEQAVNRKWCVRSSPGVSESLVGARQGRNFVLGRKLTDAVPLLDQIRVYLNHWSGHGKGGTLCWGESLLMPCPY